MTGRKSTKVVKTAAKVMKDATESTDAKNAAAFVLTQAGSDENAGVPIASCAARVLKDPRASKASKSVAASALTHRRPMK